MRVGLYFGSYNPIHMGHLIVANAMLEHGGLDEVWFVVSPQNPFKQRADLMSEERRLRMVEAAVAGNPRLKACDIELSLPRPSFTCATLEQLRQRHPGHEFAIVMGSDNLEGFPRWRQADDILARHRLVVYPRPGHTECPLADHPRVSMLPQVPLLDISSTHIRAELAAGHSIRYLVPDPVWRHLQP